MYTKTEKLIEVQQGGNDETKVVLELWKPTVASSYVHMSLYLEVTEEGNRANHGMKIGDVLASFDGTSVAIEYGDEMSGGNPVHIATALSSSHGEDSDKIFLLAAYDTGYTANFKLRVIFEEFTDD